MCEKYKDSVVRKIFGTMASLVATKELDVHPLLIRPVQQSRVEVKHSSNLDVRL